MTRTLTQSPKNCLRTTTITRISTPPAPSLHQSADTSGATEGASRRSPGVASLLLQLRRASQGAEFRIGGQVGEENFFLFGRTAEQVERSRGWYNPRWHYEHEPKTRAALDLIAGDNFSRHEPGIFSPILNALLNQGDYYRHLADLTSYPQAHQHLGELYADPEAWTHKAILNIAASGRFSSDRTIAEYAKEIFGMSNHALSSNNFG
jgi:starch phosphorylase